MKYHLTRIVLLFLMVPLIAAGAVAGFTASGLMTGWDAAVELLCDLFD